jgi:nicotinamidase-related amidase
MGDMDNAALLVMDLQNGVVERYPDGSGRLLETIGRAAVAARAAGVPVIFVRVAFRPGAPEISARNRTFSALASSGVLGTMG